MCILSCNYLCVSYQSVILITSFLKYSNLFFEYVGIGIDKDGCITYLHKYCSKSYKRPKSPYFSESGMPFYK